MEDCLEAWNRIVGPYSNTFPFVEEEKKNKKEIVGASGVIETIVEAFVQWRHTIQSVHIKTHLLLQKKEFRNFESEWRWQTD